MSWYNLQSAPSSTRIVKAMYFDSKQRDFYFQDLLVEGSAEYHGAIARNRIVEVLHNRMTGKVTLRTAAYKYIDFDARLPKNRSLFETLKLVVHDWEIVDALSIAGNQLLEMPKAALVGSRYAAKRVSAASAISL